MSARDRAGERVGEKEGNRGSKGVRGGMAIERGGGERKSPPSTRSRALTFCHSHTLYTKCKYTHTYTMGIPAHCRQRLPELPAASAGRLACAGTGETRGAAARVPRTSEGKQCLCTFSVFRAEFAPRFRPCKERGGPSEQACLGRRCLIMYVHAVGVHIHYKDAPGVRVTE